MIILIIQMCLQVVDGRGNCQLSISDPIVNTPTTYAFTFRPGSTGSQVALQIRFTEDSGIFPSTPISCTATGDTSVYSGIGCSETQGTNPYVIVTGLNQRKFSYSFTITSIVNAPKSGLVNDIECQFCTDSSCNNYLEDGATARITFEEDTMDVANVDITSSDPSNGAEYVTYTFGLLLSHNIVVQGSVSLDLPKQNYFYWYQGASNRECMLYNCDSTDLTVTVVYTNSKTDDAATGTSVATADLGSCNGSPSDAQAGICFLYEELDAMHDRITISLDNSAVINSGKYLIITMYPFKNFPSMAEVPYFNGWTGDTNFNPIEAFTGASFTNTFPGAFNDVSPSESKVQIAFSQDSTVTDLYQVGAPELSYEFDVYLKYNDIPNDSKFVVTWPSNWAIDCNNAYTVYCNVGCSFENGTALICDETINGLELFLGFTGTTPYLQYQVGYLNFVIGGITNPDTTDGMYFTLTTYHQQGEFYPIDSSYSMFYVEFNTGSVTVDEIRPDTSMIYSTAGNYYFKFAPQHAVATDYVITIQIPSELNVQQNSACILTEVEGSSTRLSSTFDCAADATNNEIVIQNFLDSDNNPGDTIEILIDSIRNPGDYTTPGTVYFTVETSDGGDVDSGSYTGWENGEDLYTHSFIQSFTAKADDQTAGAEPITYTFELTPYTRVAQGSTLILELPEDLEVADSSQLQRDCNNGELSGFSNTIVGCSYSTSNHEVTVKNGFRFKASDGDPPNLFFQLSSFRNPRSLSPTGQFNITIYNVGGDPLFYFNQSAGPQVEMKSYLPPKSFGYTRSHYENGELTNYTWQIETANYYVDGDIMTFKLPTGIRFTDATKAYGTSFWLDGELESILSGDRQSIEVVVKLSQRRRRNLHETSDYFDEDFNETIRPQRSGRRKLADSIPAGSIVNLMLTEVTSPISLRPVEGAISYNVRNAEDYLVESISEGAEVGNNETGLINPTSVGVTPDYWENNVLANYTLAFTPNNFEQNLQIWITIPPEITIPPQDERNVTVRGVKGTDQAEITSFVFYENSSILLTDAVTAKDVAPVVIELIIQSLYNPGTNIVTESFAVETRTYDGYKIDSIDSNMQVNFYCLFPCRTCEEETPSVCTSCYTATTDYIYLFDDTCLEGCPEKMFIFGEDTLTPTCSLCEFPCRNCGDNATDCLDCYPGYIYYEVEHTCYEEIIWYFPFLGGAVVCFVIVFIVDCIKRSTDFLQSLLFLLCWCEDAVLGYLLWMWLQGEVEGDRSLTVISLGVEVLLNLCFMAVHCKLMIRNGSPEYRQVFKEYKGTSWCISILSYLLNFKMSVFLVSSFAARPRWSGTLNHDGWQKFNIFALLYIGLVYLPFTADFYLYFTTFGLRKLTSYIAAEACVIRTIICLILMLEILSQCACAGINESDLGRRAGLSRDKKGKAKKKRRALRSGMGNDEEDYGDEYGSSEDGSVLDLPVAEAADDEYGDYYGEYDDEGEEEESEEEVDEEEVTAGKRKSTKKKTPGKEGELDALEKLAKQMKDEKDALKAEQQAILDEKARLLEEKEKYLDQFGDIGDRLDGHRKVIQGDLEETKEDVEAMLERKLAERERDALIRKNDKPTLVLPEPVQAEIEYSRSVDGDEEYWLQNLTAVNDDVSAANSDVREKDASLIEFIEPEDAKKSFIGSVREMEADEEMRAGQSQGGIHGNDLSQKKSYIGTEQEFLNRSNAAHGADDGNREKEGTEQDYYDGASAVFSNATGANALSKIGTEQNFINKSQADFGKLSAINKSDNVEGIQNVSGEFGENDLQMNKSMKGITPQVDQHGHSDESSEGIVADHRPFQGIKDAMAKQDELRRSEASNLNPNSGRGPNTGRSGFAGGDTGRSDPRGVGKSVDSVEEEDEDNRPSARRRIKQVLYSDKSESSVDDMMEDTPSNYNIANGRLEGKSMGLKAILLFAKNQGIQLGAGGERKADGGLPQIQEEAALTPNPGEMDGGWAPMTNPMAAGQRTRTQIAEMGEIQNRTIEESRDRKNTKSKRNPGAKQFMEPGEEGDLSARGGGNQDLGKIRKNNFV